MSRRIPVAAKIGVGFATIIALALLIGISALSNLSSVAKDSQTTYHKGAEPMERLGQAWALINANSALTIRVLMEPTAAGRAAVGATIKSNTKTVDADLAAAARTADT